MSYPEQNPQEPRVLPGYFGPAVPPPQASPPAAAPTPPSPYPPVQPQNYVQPNPLAQPLYPASFGQAVARFCRKYATFSGRASRSEFWWAQLFMAGLFFAAAMISSINGADWIVGPYALFLLGSVVPSIALAVRRVHDANLHGGLVALVIVPYVGYLVVAILALMPSRPEGARFDKVPALPHPYGQPHPDNLPRY